MKRLRAVLVLVLVAVIAYATTVATLGALRPAAFEGHAMQARVGTRTAARLARHVLFVVVDGLRWDIAHDEQTMPRFAAALRHHISAEIWSSPISMTSSAVLAYGTGQRASLDQVLENLRPPQVRVNSWLQNAHAAGLRLMGAGDPAWAQLYGKYLFDFRDDPVGAAVERDFNARTFGNARELQSRSPDFLVVHFVTPDHQGHAFGIRSARYRSSMHAFDQDLFAWLDSLPRNWTVLVTSDHGAAESGTHGTDTTEQRRCPLLAYGPGIAEQVRERRTLDQVELPGLFAALLGVPTAEQSRGAALLEWLDVPAQARRQLACAETARIARLWSPEEHSGANSGGLSAANTCCSAGGAQRDCVNEARAAASEYDTHLGRNEGVQSRHVWPWIGVVMAASFALGVLLWGKRAIMVTAWLGFWLVVSLCLTLWVERLAGGSPNAVRALLFAITNLVLLAGTVWFEPVSVAFQRQPALMLSVFPGWLLVSYSTNTQIEAYVLVVVFTAALWVPQLRRVCNSKPTSGRLRQPASVTLILLVTSLALLALAGTKPSDVRPHLFSAHPVLASGLGAAVLLVGLARWWSQAGMGLRRVSWLLPLCFVLQHVPLHGFGRAGWLLAGLASAAAAFRKRADWSWFFAAVGYAWVARDYEWLLVAPALFLADTLGHACADRAKRAPASVSWVHACAVDVGFLFALLLLLRIGLQGGLQLETLDLTVGTFGDAALPHWLSALLLTYKFLIPQVLLMALYLRHQPMESRPRVLSGLGVAHLVRVACLLSMLFFCGQSYWTAFRVVADLPLALLTVFGVLLAVGLQKLLPQQA